MEARTARFSGRIAREWSPGRCLYSVAAAGRPAFPARGGEGAREQDAYRMPGLKRETAAARQEKAMGSSRSRKQHASSERFPAWQEPPSPGGIV
ncbi:hypothetical protein NDU88_007189 [Pleurodeles waltl]|uniref:Uncharacterized protein n=1 Tax=Pleurodeles waltl TaxID=8319 RepID=A0AAV7NSE3_PLEWA|nr:hypothetical protein NDU88_007189 [Pleurodeles waltl]